MLHRTSHLSNSRELLCQCYISTVKCLVTPFSSKCSRQEEADLLCYLDKVHACQVQPLIVAVDLVSCCWLMMVMIARAKKNNEQKDPPAICHRRPPWIQQRYHGFRSCFRNKRSKQEHTSHNLSFQDSCIALHFDTYIFGCVVSVKLSTASISPSNNS